MAALRRLTVVFLVRFLSNFVRTMRQTWGCETFARRAISRWTRGLSDSVYWSTFVLTVDILISAGFRFFPSWFTFFRRWLWCFFDNLVYIPFQNINIGLQKFLSDHETRQCLSRKGYTPPSSFRSLPPRKLSSGARVDCCWLINFSVKRNFWLLIKVAQKTCPTL